MVGLWYESKKHLLEELAKREKPDPSKEENPLTIEELRDYFTETQSIFHRWMKIQTHEEKNMASALVIDQLVKSLMIKIDQVFTIKNQQIDDIQ